MIDEIMNHRDTEAPRHREEILSFVFSVPLCLCG